MSLSKKLLSEVSYIEIVVGIVAALILVTLWQRTIENWLFEVLLIDRRSTFQTFIVAIAATLIFFVFINIVESLARDVILGVNKNGARSTTTGSVFADGVRTTIKIDTENQPCDATCEPKCDARCTCPTRDSVESSKRVRVGRRRL